jgi:hypothetical protein
VDKRSKVVLLIDVGWNVFCRDAHVLVAILGRAKVKISMAAVSIFALGVDRVLLRRSLMVFKVAVGVLTLPL